MNQQITNITVAQMNAICYQIKVPSNMHKNHSLKVETPSVKPLKMNHWISEC